MKWKPISIAGASLLVLALWLFPSVWYRASERLDAYVWFEESESVEGWDFEAVPIGKSAEAVIHADKMFNGRFSGPMGESVNVYSAKRYSAKKNEIGLFSHTPDRCWVNVGWEVTPNDPDCVRLVLHGADMILERRVFQAGDQRELVYFGALVGGKPLPYRIDQYYRAALRRSSARLGDDQGTWSRILQGRMWGWAMESFYNRSPLRGAQQFIRVSTPVPTGGDLEGKDALLQRFMSRWLVPVDYRKEWERRRE